MRNKPVYKLKVSDGFPRVQIEGVHYERPKTLSKYFCLNEQNVTAAITRNFFVATPDLFNDLFDTLYVRIPSKIENLEFYRSFFDRDNSFDEILFNTDKAYRDRMRNTLFSIWNSKVGILCTTEDTQNDLMWAHYSNNDGFLIQFDYSKFPLHFGDPIPINYLKNSEMNQFLDHSPFLQLYVNALMKKSDWEYENEFRFIVYPKDAPSFRTSGTFSNEDHNTFKMESRLQSYSKESVVKIILGPNFFLKLYAGGNKIDFGKPTGLIRKALIDYTIKEEIEVELLNLEIYHMKFLPVKFILTHVNGLIYEINYVT